MAWKLFSGCSIGGYHIEKGLPCQDAAVHVDAGSWYMGAVADGHGSRKHFRSGLGSKIACTVAVMCSTQWMKEWQGSKVAEEQVAQFQRELITQWCKAVECDIAQNPWTDEELEEQRMILSKQEYRELLDGKNSIYAYGTTLLVLLVVKQYWLALQLGDGDFALLQKDGQIKWPMPESCMNEDNFTASICMPHPMKDFRFCCGVDMPAAFFLYTDGLEKAFLPSRGMKLACYLHKVMQFAIQEDGQGEKMIEKGLAYVADSSRTRDDTSLMVMADANAKDVVLQTMPLSLSEDYQRIQSAIKECRSTLTYNRKRLEENGNAADFMAKETIQRIQGIIERKNAELFTLMEQADNLLVEMEKWSVVLPQGGPEKTDSQPAVRVQQPESASVPKVDTATEEMHDEWVMEWEETPNMANVEIVKAANALGLCADHPQISPKVSDADDTDIDGSGTHETDDPATAAGRTL